MRLFGSDNIANIMEKLGMGEDDPIEHKLVTRSIEQAQKKLKHVTSIFVNMSLNMMMS